MAERDEGQDSGGRRRKSGVRKSTLYKGRGRGMTGPPLPMSPAEIIALAQGMGRGRGMTGVTPDLVRQLAFPMSGDDARQPMPEGVFPPGVDFTKDEPSGGFDMQNIAPSVLMRPRPDRGIAPDGNDGMTAQDQLLQMLTEMATQPGPTFDVESAMQEAAQGIRQAYGAEIAAIRQNNRVARKSTKRARKEIEGLYKGLANMFDRQGARALRRGEKSSDAQTAIFDEGNDYLTQLNNQMIQDEAQLLQDLNAGQAAPEVISPDFDRMGQQVQDNTEMGEQAASRALRMGDNNARWFDRAQAGARFEGADTSAEMLSNLAAFVNSNRGDIAGLKGDRAREIASSNANLQAQAAQAAGDARQQSFDNILDVLGIATNIEDTNIDNALAADRHRWDKRMDRRQIRADEMEEQESNLPTTNLDEALSIIANTQEPGDQKATNALLRLVGSNAWRTGQVPSSSVPGETLKLTPYEARARAHRMGMNLGLRGRQLADFVEAAVVSLG